MQLIGIDFSKPSLYWLLPFVLLTLLLNAWSPQSSTLIFISSCVSIIPLAALLSDATREISSKIGDVFGGFLNATFGNAAEFIIAIIALYSGKIDLVKATLTGSIIGNILLVLGLSFFLGGIKNKTQQYNKLGAESLSAGLIIAVVGLITPAAYAKFTSGTETANVQLLSYLISGILLIIYLAFLYFSLFTHRKMMEANDNLDESGHHDSYGWNLPISIFMLAFTAFLIALMSEILVKHIEHAAQAIGISTAFIGIIVVAIVGNAAEHSTAVLMAMKNKIDISINIAVGSSTQVALLLVPALVLLSLAFPLPMDLIFPSGQILLIVLSTLIVNHLLISGKSTWFKGVQLLGIYAIIATIIYFV
jgi:Ca2+:H+ antiporter